MGGFAVGFCQVIDSLPLARDAGLFSRYMPLSEEQRRLYESLNRRNAQLGKKYLGCLMMLDFRDNPMQYELAAHSMREMMDKLPDFVHGITYARGSGDGMGNRISPVRQAFHNMRKHTSLNQLSWQGEVDGPMKGFLTAADKFFQWDAEHRSSRSARGQAALKALSGFGPPLPPDVFEKEVSEWCECEQFFIQVAHSDRTTDEEQFLVNLRTVEEILIRRLAPTAQADANELDVLMREG